MIGSLKWNFLVLILFLLYIVLLLQIAVSNLLKKLHIVNKLHWCLVTTYSKNMFAINFNTKRQFFIDDW